MVKAAAKLPLLKASDKAVCVAMMSIAVLVCPGGSETLIAGIFSGVRRGLRSNLPRSGLIHAASWGDRKLITGAVQWTKVIA